MKHPDSFSARVKNLATQVDCKWDQLSDEDYIRLDLSAHEKLDFERVFQAPQQLQRAVGGWMKGIVRFAVSSAAIFTVLFGLSNAPAYYTLLKANLVEYFEAREANIEWQTVSSLSTDPWNGETLETKVLVEDHPVEIFLASDSFVQGEVPLLDLTVTPLENRIDIPTIGVNGKIVEMNDGLNTLKSQDWLSFSGQMNESLLEGIVHYPGTAYPGQKGNAVLTGHSSTYFWDAWSAYSTIFARLSELKVGDQVQITYNQELFTYQITQIYEVSPEDVSVLQQGEGHTLTLITCTPVGTQLKRLIVVGELVQ